MKIASKVRSLSTIALAILSLNTLQANDNAIPENIEHSIHEGFTKMANEPGAVIFSPPEGWRVADPNALPSSVNIMVVGKGQHEFPPSINLGTEAYKGTLQQYLKTVKAINDSQGAEWKDLGTIRTDAGNASLSQVDATTEWGEIRMMHVILIQQEKAYILTAAALKQEFSTFYKDFFNSMRSLRINKDAIQMITNPQKKEALIERINELKTNWAKYLSEYFEPAKGHPSSITIEQRAFKSSQFQNQNWKPFVAMISNNYRNMTPEWREHILRQTREELISEGTD